MPPGPAEEGSAGGRVEGWAAGRTREMTRTVDPNGPTVRIRPQVVARGGPVPEGRLRAGTAVLRRRLTVDFVEDRQRRKCCQGATPGRWQ
ncbi:hypothetical protein GCM10027290_46060 [Micromonospora sonneratiae]